MDVAQIRALKPRLDNYLARFEDCFSRCDTREHLAVYVTGQLSDLAQKSVEPIALAAGVPHQLCQFHYLREAAKPIYEADRHAKVGLKKKVRGVRQGRAPRGGP